MNERIRYEDLEPKEIMVLMAHQLNEVCGSHLPAVKKQIDGLVEQAKETNETVRENAKAVALGKQRCFLIHGRDPTLPVSKKRFWSLGSFVIIALGSVLYAFSKSVEEIGRYIGWW